MLHRLHTPELQREDEVEVGATWLLIDRTRVQADCPRQTLTVSHVGHTDGIDVDHREGSEEDLSGRCTYVCFLLFNLFTFIS